MFFGKKKKQVQNNEQLLLSLNGREVKYVSRRDSNSYGETVLGKNGRININGEDLVILCEGVEVFRHPMRDIEGGEFMSHDGINLRYLDSHSENKYTIVAYYKYYRKV